MTEQQQTTTSPRVYELKLEHYRQKVMSQEEQIANLRVEVTELQEQLRQFIEKIQELESNQKVDEVPEAEAAIKPTKAK